MNTKNYPKIPYYDADFLFSHEGIDVYRNSYGWINLQLGEHPAYRVVNLTSKDMEEIQEFQDIRRLLIADKYWKDYGVGVEGRTIRRNEQVDKFETDNDALIWLLEHAQYGNKDAIEVLRQCVGNDDFTAQLLTAERPIPYELFQALEAV